MDGNDDDGGSGVGSSEGAVTESATFGNLVRTLREQRGWSQDDLAQRVSRAGSKMRQSRLAEIEARGPHPRTISLDQAAAFATVFNIPLPDMLDPRGHAESIRTTMMLDVREMELMRLLDEVNQLRRQFFKLANSRAWGVNFPENTRTVYVLREEPLSDDGEHPEAP